ncbi:MAG: hypothetical protein HY396_02265 [Candidatus Doudnabacteria bacterium]|nr:hypothetical protein [Candidatus Doudnabacteria bacterium]
MAILIHKLKSLNPKKAIAVVSLAGLIALALSYIPALAQGPAFNIFPISYTGELNKDLPLLDGRNASQFEGWSASQADHDAGVQASAGQILEFSVYYHNGAADADENVAINTIIKAFANPTLGQTALTHTISATIGADNATTVSSSDPFRGGNMTVHIQGGTPLSLSLVPGSVTLFRDQGLVPKPGPVTLPDTVFTTGVNIGNVRGCFQYHGFVNFKLRVQEAALGALQVQKQVKNITKGIPFNDTEVAADPGNTVEYQIVVNAVTNPVPSVVIKDALDSRLSLLGSVTVDGVIVSGSQFFGSGVNVGTITPGVAKIIRFQALVASASQFTVGTHILTNVATATSGQVSAQDGANVKVIIQPQVVTCNYTWDPPLVADGSLRGLRRVGDLFNVREQISGLSSFQSFNKVFQHVSGSPTFRFLATADANGNYDVKDTSFIHSAFTTGDYSAFIEVNNAQVATCKGMRIEPPVVQQIDLDKTVKNETNPTAFLDQVDAQPSQQVSFKIVISPQNSNMTLENVTVRDALPAKMTFVSSSFNVDGVFMSEGNFFTTGINLGSMQPSQQKVITFKANIFGPSDFVTGSCENLTNSATVTSGSLSDTDTAVVRVCKEAPTKQPGSPGPRPLN